MPRSRGPQDTAAAPLAQRTRPTPIKVIAIICITIGCVGVLTLTLGVALLFLFFGIIGIGIGIAGLAFCYLAIAAGMAAWKGKPWGRFGTLGVLCAAALWQIIFVILRLADSPMALLHPYLLGSLVAAGFAVWYVDKPEARAWFAVAPKP